MAVAVFPEASVAVHVTVVVPSGKVAGALFVITTEGSQISVAVAVPRGISDNGVFSAVASTVTPAGAVRPGEIVSCTVTV